MWVPVHKFGEIDKRGQTLRLDMHSIVPDSLPIYWGFYQTEPLGEFPVKMRDNVLYVFYPYLEKDYYALGIGCRVLNLDTKEIYVEKTVCIGIIPKDSHVQPGLLAEMD